MHHFTPSPRSHGRPCMLRHEILAQSKMMHFKSSAGWQRLVQYYSFRDVVFIICSRTDVPPRTALSLHNHNQPPAKLVGFFPKTLERENISIGMLSCCVSLRHTKVILYSIFTVPNTNTPEIGWSWYEFGALLLFVFRTVRYGTVPRYDRRYFFLTYDWIFNQRTIGISLMRRAKASGKHHSSTL